jgi:hypothetical protein
VDPDVRNCLGCAGIFTALILLFVLVLLEVAWIQECQERTPGITWHACLVAR